MKISEQVAELEQKLARAEAEIDDRKRESATYRRAFMHALGYANDAAPLMSWDALVVETMTAGEAALAASAQPCPTCGRPIHGSVRQGLGVVLDSDGPHTCRMDAAKADSPRIGGNPPEPEIGMVYRQNGWTHMVTKIPWYWPDDVSEIRAPWGGPVVWRREPSNG